MDGGDEGAMATGMEDLDKVKYLHDLVMKANQQGWDCIVHMFRYVPAVQATKINRWGDTALHIAVDSSSDHVVSQLVDVIANTPHASQTLSVKNDAGDTPLHAAAARGSLPMCRCIVNHHQDLLIKDRNERGETPVFLAAIYGHSDAFRYLLGAVGEEDRLRCCRRLNGDTILHCTIKREYFDMSLLILQLCKEISYWINEKGQSPLEILASTPSAFKSGIQLKWWEQPCFDLRMLRINTSVGEELFVQIDQHETTLATKRKTDTHDVGTGAAFSRFSSILEKTKRYKRALLIMRQLLENDIWYEALIDRNIRGVNKMSAVLSFDKGSHTKTGNPSRPLTFQIRPDKWWDKGWASSALLTATKHGATEVVEEILRRKPFAIDDETRDKKNIVLVAIEARQTSILRQLMKHPSWCEKRLKYAKDLNGNTALHLAAKRSVNANMAVSITHLQWEVLWFQFVQKLMPPSFMNKRNNEGKTPATVFAEEHNGMLKRSDEWVKEMSGSYIVASTLISGVTFATSYQIPGGYNSQDGTPVIGPNTPAFRVFSLSALVSFCFSITSLASFLSIYSSRLEYRQYRRSLPLTICFGFFTLFISIVSMLLSFCAAHVFELNPKHKSKCVPVYISLALIPLVFYSATQLQLYLGLLRASLSTVPLPRPFYVGPEQHPEEEVEEEQEEEEEERHESQTTTSRKRIRTRTRWSSINKPTSDTADIKHII